MALALHSGLSPEVPGAGGGYPETRVRREASESRGKVSRDKSQEGGLGKSGEDGVQELQLLQCLGQGLPKGGRHTYTGSGAGACRVERLAAGSGRQGRPLICCALRFAPSKRQFPAALGRGSHRASSGAHSLSGMGGGRMQMGDLTATRLRCWDPDTEAQAWCGHCEVWFFRQSCTDMSVGP